MSSSEGVDVEDRRACPGHVDKGMDMEIPAAWHPDPLERHELRYWDGAKWTEHVSDGGTTALDPLDDQEAVERIGEDVARTHDATPPVPGVTTPATAEPTPAGNVAGQFDQVLASMSQQARATNRIATSAMVVGIIALVFSVIPVAGAVVGFPLGGYAAVAGIIGLLIAKKSGQGRAASIAGIVLGGLAIAIAAFQAIVLGQIADEFFRML